MKRGFRHKRKGQRQNSVERKKEMIKFNGKVQGRNVNYEEKKQQKDVGKRQETE